jgi:hypothetical protein
LHSLSRPLVIVIEIDVAVLCLCLVESTCRFGSCCDLHQNRFLGRNLCYIDNIAFVFAVAAVLVVVIAAADDYSSVLDNHEAH